MQPIQRTLTILLLLVGLTYSSGSTYAASPIQNEYPLLALTKTGSLTDRSMQWPSWNTWRRVILLEDYNTRVVVLGTTLLGLAAGMVGSLTLLRKRALMGDALSHATYPGIGLAYITATLLGYDGKTLPVLLLGAAVSGILGMLAILLIRNQTRLKEDAALGIVLSVFFGAGAALIGIVQQMKTGNAAGLESFVYGKTASLTAMDSWMIGGAGLFCAATCILLFKELKLLCFDEGFAGSDGYPVVALDVVLMVLVIVVTIIGLQAVGLILMIALLVIPAAAARFWTQRLTRMMVISAVIGAVSGMLGSAMSAILPKLPSGAMIVLTSTMFFFISMIFGAKRGVLFRWLGRVGLNRKIDRQHVLRGLFEQMESLGASAKKALSTKESVATQSFQQSNTAIPFKKLLSMRSWSPRRLRKEIARAERESLLYYQENKGLRFTEEGYRQAARLVHEHRLWEIYLITHADIAPANVDRYADTIEHVLEPRMISKLEELLIEEQTASGIAASPHPIELDSF